MTEIGFHFNVATPGSYACRLVRKAMRHGASIAVTGPKAMLDAIDRDLWALSPTDFIAHAWVADAASVPARLHATTAWLAPDALEAPVQDALVNVGDVVPRGFESFRRLIEVVSPEEADRAAARERWKGYVRRGYAIERHEANE